MLRAEPVGEDELEKARANFLASQHWERESVSGMARKIGSFHLIAGDHRREADYLERIRIASTGELQRVAREWLTALPETGILVSARAFTWTPCGRHGPITTTCTATLPKNWPS